MPDPPQKRRIDALARQALNHPPSERRTFLRAACNAPDLRAAVEARVDVLLKNADTIDAAGDADPTGADATEAAVPPPEARTEPGSLPEEASDVPPDALPEEDATAPAPDNRPGDADHIEAQRTQQRAQTRAASQETGGGTSSGSDRTQTREALPDSDATETQPASNTPRPSTIASLARPRRVGPWRLVHIIGRGGMGAVHLAERDDGQFQQRAALKLIRQDLGPAAQQRFLSERQILAQLQHPNIAHLLDGGVTDDGRPYFAMEYVDGTPLDEYCNTNGLDVEARLRLFQQVCNAVQFAHRNLIVHRDLKPGNILVTERGTGTQTQGTTTTGPGPQVKLLDFGIAKALEDADAAGLTRTGEGGPMTPSYAAPEQVQGQPITTATDVYALGVVLCELLTGALPYDIRGRSMVEAAQIIVHETPRRLSQQVVTHLSEEVAQAYDASSKALRRTLRGDLDVIVEKALRKEPGQRYAAAAELGQDLGRYLDGMPVEARPATTGYRIRRFVDRNRPAVLGAAGALVALVVGLGVAVWQGQVAAAERDRAEAALVEAAHERDRAQQQAARAGAVQTFLVDMIGRAAPATTGGTALTVREVLDEADTELMTPAMQNQPEVSMQVRTTLGRMYRVLGRGEAAVRQGRLAYRMGLQHLGAADSLTLQTGSQYGISLLRTGQIQKADSLYGILVPRLNHVEASPALRFVVLSHYGEVLRHQSRLDSAEAVLDTALRWYDRSSQPDTTLWTTALSNLGGVYRRQGRLDDAEDAYRRALTIAEERASEERLPSIAILANNLGNVYANRGDYAEAEPLLRRSLTLMTDLFGETSGNVAATLTNLSRSLYEQGKLTEADRLSKRAVALHREVFPPSDYRIGFALGVRARILLARGQWRATQTSADESLRLFRNALGAQHPATLGMHQTLADVHERLGAWDAAATHSEAALAGYRAVRDSTDAAVIGTRVQLGRVRTMQGRYDEAERLLLAAHRVQTGDSLTSVHRETHNWLVRLYDAWGRPDAAERWRGEAQ